MGLFLRQPLMLTSDSTRGVEGVTHWEARWAAKKYALKVAGIWRYWEHNYSPRFITHSRLINTRYRWGKGPVPTSAPRSKQTVRFDSVLAM